MAEIRNVGIFAHVDAGKTTLSEQLLLKAQAIRVAGSVDKGTAHTDTLPVERRRGISVRAACVRLKWHDVSINLIDTPGHTDFSAEIERSMWALDGAVLVISATEGVQPQTELLFDAMKAASIPVIFFINKTDRDTADVPAVMRDIRKRLSANSAILTDANDINETAANVCDELLDLYLSSDPGYEEALSNKLPELVRTCSIYPVVTGSALRGTGIEPLLDSIVDLLPAPVSSGKELSAIAFSSARDKALGKGFWIRVFGGKLEARDRVTVPGRLDSLTGERLPVEAKISQIRGVDGTDTGMLSSGEIGIVFGLGEIKVGQVLGNEELLPRKVSSGTLRSPVMMMNVLPANPDEMTKLAAACLELSQEDPLLRARHIQTTGELQVDVMGNIQTEILQDEIQTRYGIDVSFGQPSVIYRETIAHEAIGFCAYTMPKPCWAILKFVITPAPRGSGVTFHSEVEGRDLLPRYQHQVEQAIPLALNQGRLGWKVTDVDITLIDGNHHQWHTHPLDFIVATPWAIQDGLARGGSILLEPIMEFRIHAPSASLGKIITDVNEMRGEIITMRDDDESVFVVAHVPAATSMDYSIRLARVTSGKGSMSAQLHSYKDCPLELGHTTPRRNVDPLDTSKYILAARSALESGIFDVDE